jgi:hypothetical protein
MCFELLGFDIILDRECKPFLLEVNHAPSFTCDALIDYEIKYKLIKDTLGLLNLDINSRRKIIQNLYDERQERLIGFSAARKGSYKDLNLLFQINEKIQMDIEYEQEMLGDYEMIYPLKTYDPDQEQTVYLPSPNFPLNGSPEVETRGLTKSPSRKGSEPYLHKTTSNKNIATSMPQETPITDRKINSGLASSEPF